jgi:hypothetical protein
MQRVAANDALSTKYSDQVHFIIVYTVEAHPNYFYDARNYEERVDLANACIEKGGIGVLVLVDNMDDHVWRAYGAQPNNAFLIGTDGIILEREDWYNPGRMENAILSHLG